MENTSVIKIRIKDGMIVQVEDIPENIMLMIYDYDVDYELDNGPFNPSMLSKDDNKKPCYIYTYDINDCRKENI